MVNATQDTACRNGQLGSSAALQMQSGATFPRTGAPQAPELGAEISFQRTPTHQWERGLVRGRQFGTGIIDVVDENAKPLRLTPDQYKAIKV